MHQGLEHCNLNENLLVKAIKHQVSCSPAAAA
jgi:hypothetical protein